MKTSSFSITIILTLIVNACNKATPSGFWKDYNKTLLVKNISDQGFYGGHRTIYWKTNKPNTFTAASILDYAGKNGWTFTDSLKFDEDQTNKWVYNGKAVFPLTSTGFSNKVSNNTELEHFRRWFGGQIRVYKFKTGWMMIEPGTDNSIDENGFVVINQDGTEMAAYHLWGE